MEKLPEKLGLVLIGIEEPKMNLSDEENMLTLILTRMIEMVEAEQAAKVVRWKK